MIRELYHLLLAALRREAPLRDLLACYLDRRDVDRPVPYTPAAE